jgi:hypothetical protein
MAKRKRCKPHQIRFDAQTGKVRFVGRAHGCMPPAEASAAMACSKRLFAKAVEFCKLTSKSKLQQRLCVGPTMRSIGSVGKCKEKK